jgi:hypothetical protein
MTTTVSFEEIPDDVKKLRKLLKDAEFFGAKHGGSSVSPGEVIKYHPNLITFWHKDVLFHANVEPNGDAVLRCEDVVLGRVPMNDRLVASELKHFVDRFMNHSVAVSQDGDRIAAVKGATDDTPVWKTKLFHLRCRGAVERVEIATGRAALVCRECYLRVVIPNDGMVTFGRLRELFRSFNP